MFCTCPTLSSKISLSPFKLFTKSSFRDDIGKTFDDIFFFNILQESISRKLVIVRLSHTILFQVNSRRTTSSFRPQFLFVLSNIATHFILLLFGLVPIFPISARLSISRSLFQPSPFPPRLEPAYHVPKS